MRIADAKPGVRVGRLTVVSVSGPLGGKDRSNRNVVVDCDCGRRVTKKLHAVGRCTNSCGCLYRESVRMPLTHGHASHGKRHPDYALWIGMRDRCSNPNNAGWVHYGGRGIRVCDRWHSFENFIADMGPRPSKEFSIDRINVNGNYEPGNCRWANDTTQARNARSVPLVTFRGETRCIAEWAEVLGIKAQVIHGRLHNGWSIERALSVAPNSERVVRGQGTHLFTRKVLAFVSEHPGASWVDIVAALPGNKHSRECAVSKVVKRGLIRREGTRGKYRYFPADDERRHTLATTGSR